MLDGRKRDDLVRQVKHGQLSALHRALDAAWMAGYEARKAEGGFTYAEAARKLSCSARVVSREARRLGIPRPLTAVDVDRLGYAVYGPHGRMPKFSQMANGHFKIKP